MKALHVQTFCCEGMLHFIHGGGSYVDGVFVPERKLLIQYEHKTAHAVEGDLGDFTSSSPGDGRGMLKAKVIKETEVSDEIVNAALALIAARSDFTAKVATSWSTLIGKA
ncbi:MAG: hypothetical protein AAB699_00600 [Patescibacteria group bacterium]